MLQTIEIMHADYGLQGVVRLRQDTPGSKL